MQHNPFEKIISSLVGALAGLVAGILLLSLEVMPKGVLHAETLLPVSGLIGLLIAIMVMEYKKDVGLAHNQKIRDETVALITHEMRTGLTSTGWAIQLMLQNYEKYITPEDKKMLEDVVASIHTTVMHSVNLLDISLLDIGKLSISLEKMPLDEVEKIFSETIAKYSFGAKGKGINLISSVKLDKSRQVEVDRVRIRIILENLLANAIQYTTGEKKEVKVEVSNDASNLHIMVKDTGIGIPEKEQKTIFSEFYRASNARKQLSSGSGIGLYMCKQYVTTHRGTIRFESKENEGTTFYISIPLTTAADVTGFLDKV